MARSGTVLGSQTYVPSLFLAYFCPGSGLVTGAAADVVSTGTQYGSAGVANGLVLDG